MSNTITLAGKERNIRRAGPRDVAKSEAEAKEFTKNKKWLGLLACINLVRNVVTPPLSDKEFEDLTFKEISEVLLKAVPNTKVSPQPFQDYGDWTVNDVFEQFRDSSPTKEVK